MYILFFSLTVVVKYLSKKEILFFFFSPKRFYVSVPFEANVIGPSCPFSDIWVWDGMQLDPRLTQVKFLQGSAPGTACCLLVHLKLCVTLQSCFTRRKPTNQKQSQWCTTHSTSTHVYVKVYRNFPFDFLFSKGFSALTTLMKFFDFRLT